jgi:hypothetical protein
MRLRSLLINVLNPRVDKGLRAILAVKGCFDTFFLEEIRMLKLRLLNRGFFSIAEATEFRWRKQFECNSEDQSPFLQLAVCFSYPSN